MATMADSITSTDDLPQYVLDGLFDSFSDEPLSDGDDRNNNDVGELSDRARGKTDTDSGSIFIGIGPVAMNVLANIQMNTSVIYV